MTDVSSPVPSPCIAVCLMDARGEYCRGCRRTLQEIAAWSSMTDAGKRAVWDRLRRLHPLQYPRPGASADDRA